MNGLFAPPLLPAKPWPGKAAAHERKLLLRHCKRELTQAPVT